MRTLLLALTLGAAGCLTPVSPPDRIVRLDAARVTSVRTALASASGPAGQGVIVRQFADAGLTPLADGSFRAGPDGALAAGLVPGRNPVARSSLVIVGAAASHPEAATLLEVARLLAGRSRYEVAPERSVLFALWDNSIEASQAIGAVRRSSVWPEDLVTDVLIVGEVPPTLSATPLDVAGPASVEAAVAQIVEAARRPRLEADSLSAP
ncbi:MAG: hypothetical protein AAGJ11_00320 [Bacteroidota bacterium]